MLHVKRFTMSDNNITELPLSMRNMKKLEDLNIDNNPLILPPAHVRVHRPTQAALELPHAPPNISCS